MIKGVNKQIIEIKCPKDEHFEKILLFVNSEKCTLSGESIDEKAKLTAKRFLAAHKEGNTCGLRHLLGKHRVGIGVSAAAFAGLLIYSLARFV